MTLLQEVTGRKVNEESRTKLREKGEGGVSTSSIIKRLSYFQSRLTGALHMAFSTGKRTHGGGKMPRKTN